MSKPLTRRQSEILQFLENYAADNGGAPTLQEICDHFGFKSVSSAREHLRLIERKGFLTKIVNRSRSIRVVKQDSRSEPSQHVSVPLLGRIAAGAPSFALEETDKILDLPKDLFAGRKLFALRIQGDSMVNAGIFDGDIAILKSQADFVDGDIAAVVVDEEATLKRLFRTPKGLRLHPENDAYADRIVSQDTITRSCRIAGVLVGTIRRF